MYFITLLLPELRLQSNELQLLFIRNFLSNLTDYIALNSAVQLGLAQLGSAQLGCIQLIAFEKVSHASDLVFPVVLQLLYYYLGLNFGSTNLLLNFFQILSRSKYCSTSQPVLELTPQSTLPTSFHSSVSRALFFWILYKSFLLASYTYYFHRWPLLLIL